MVLNDLGIDLEEFRDLFIDEGRRHLQTLNAGILGLEQDPEDAATLQDVFRAAHTLKGMAATMGYDSITKVAHAMEDLLDRARTHPESLTPDLISLLFDAIDAVETLVNDVVEGGNAQLDVSATLAMLRASESMVLSPQPVGSRDRQTETLPEREEAPSLGMMASSALDDDYAGEASPALLGAEDVELFRGAIAMPMPPVRETVPAVAESLPVARTVQLDVEHLDQLLDIVTQMVIHRSYLARLEGQRDFGAMSEAFSVHSRLVDQLQSAVLDTRLVRIGQVFNRFPRMVRDLLKAQNKEAQLVIEGAQVELDRTTLASVGDSLVHLLRNAVDHGLDLPEDRVAAGKPRQGTIRLSASHERSVVVVEVRDDGRGIDVQAIADKALRRGVVTPEGLAEMNEAQVLELICAPGFSLASEVTAISGRGVGMDAVKRQIELMRGKLEIETRLGYGSTFRLYLPVNLALLDALIVMVAGEWYAVPATHVEHVVEVDSTLLTHVGDKVLMNLAEDILPLRSACEYFGGDACSADSAYALIMRRHNRPFGVGVDGIIGYEQIVAKPLPPILEANTSLSGVTILGEGRVAFIVDLVNG